MTKMMLAFSCLLLARMTAAQTEMFRGTPDHVSSYTDRAILMFTSQAWRFDAGAPVRSSAVASASLVFVGASDGTCYALDKATGKVKWKTATGQAIESSPALDKGRVFFCNNRQRLFALDAASGRLAWSYTFASNKNYDWGFDYYYSSPVIRDHFLVVGAKDGFLYKFNESNGKLIWKFAAQGVVRSTPAIAGSRVYFGDTEGILYALDFVSGKELWHFKSVGHGLKNEDYGFDRRAFISSPTVAGGKVYIGGRDGFFYAIDAESGKEIWRVDHHVSWVISSPAVRDTVVVTGTSDGQFVQAVSTHTGKEIWKTKTSSIVWSSPIIYNGQVYVGSGEGVLYCLDLTTGRIMNRFHTSGSIFSSPVISDSLLFIGSDDGRLYALKNGLPHPSPEKLKRFVFYEPGVNIYFRGGTDARIRTYLVQNGFSSINSLKLDSVLRVDSSRSVIVFASNYFPRQILDGYGHSLLRNYLDRGGRVVVCGLNPVVAVSDGEKNLKGFNFLLADSVLGIHYGPADLRSHKGIYPSFVTAEGRRWGMRNFWISSLGLASSQVDIVLGTNENGLAAAWVKKYHPSRGSGFVQIWLEQDGTDDLSYILNVAEYDFD